MDCRPTTGNSDLFDEQIKDLERRAAAIFSAGPLSPRYRPILDGRRELVGAIEECAMGKERHNSKEAKKPALKSPKEKKAAKQAKKHASDVVPIVTR
jgi:hypothetical protein